MTSVRAGMANVTGALVVLAVLVAAPAMASAATVEVHYDTLDGSTYTRAGDFTSDFSPGDNANGTWQLLPTTSGPPELGFVKTRNTGSGAVEVHLDTVSGGTYKRVADYRSDFNSADAANGHFILFGSANGAPELGFVKTANTGSGAVEVHYDTLSGGTYTRAGDFASDFSTADAANGVWQLEPAPSGTAPVLGFIKTANTGSGTVEVHWDTLHGSRYVRVGDASSDFALADSSNGVWQLIATSSTTPELGFIKTRSTGSGHIEAHWDALSSNGVFTRAGDHASDFSLADATNGTWLFTATSGAPELGFVKTDFPAPAATTPVQSAPVTVTLPVPTAKRHVRVTIRMSWTWRGKRTRLTKVKVGRMPRGATMAVRCRGRGCPRPQVRQTRARRVQLFTTILAGQRYRAGDRLFVTIRAPGLIAERAVITIRNGRKPAVRAL